MSAAEQDDVADGLARIRAGDRRALARAISWVERDDPRGRAVSRLLVSAPPRGQVIGVTGPPGAGKSTLTNSFVRELRSAGDKVGVVAIDPTSPFGGGALLGDRLRMSEHVGDREVFVRSMASRGRVGGLSLAAPFAVALIDAWQADRIILETVGIGQNEIDVAACADVVVLVVSPATGDSIQALKSGVMEVPDVVVVNSRGGDGGAARETVQQLRTALQLGGRRSGTQVVAVDALSGDGVAELVAEIVGHPVDPVGTRHPQVRARYLADAAVHARVTAAASSPAGVAVLDDLASGRAPDLASVVDRLLRIALATGDGEERAVTRTPWS